MMPPEKGYTPITGRRVVPYPNESLKLGPGLWLTQEGNLTSETPISECELTAETLEYWEERAVTGQGKPLSELIV